ncbi:MAG: DAK2 domain-containing protein, partial [Chloroflexota bacterium]|nr:DAK2 domain-containing protein [Chloroflexota bacterium]
MNGAIQSADVAEALRRAGQVLADQSEYLTQLDQAIGDGDMGITMGRIGMALLGYVEQTEVDDIGKYLAQAGMTANRAGPSTMGTLFSTALMRAGKAVRGKTELSADDLAQMFQAADEGVAERGKANLGDKTVRDALSPAAEAFAAAIADGRTTAEAASAALVAAEAGRDRVTPQRSKVGRAGWVG